MLCNYLYHQELRYCAEEVIEKLNKGRDSTAHRTTFTSNNLNCILQDLICLLHRCGGILASISQEGYFSSVEIFRIGFTDSFMNTLLHFSDIIVWTLTVGIAAA